MGFVQKNITDRLFESLKKCGVTCKKWQHLTGQDVDIGLLQHTVSCHALYLCASQHKDCPKVTKLTNTVTKAFAKQPAAMKGP